MSVTVVGFDTDQTITKGEVSCLMSSPYYWVGRYITSWSGSYTLTSSEVSYIHQAGLSIVSIWMGAQWSTSPLTMNGANGTTEGQMAVNSAISLGQVQKSVIVLDIESWDTTVSSSINYAEYCNNWATAVNSGGYFPCLYANASTFNAMGSTVKSHFDGFWIATGAPISSIPSGYAIAQGTNENSTCGVTPIDYDLMNSSDFTGDWTW